MQHLNRAELNEEEFKYLQKLFLDRTLVGDDIFQNTTPGELNRFRSLVKARAPFDVVIDGLNVGYMAGNSSGAEVSTSLVSALKSVCNISIPLKIMLNFVKNDLRSIPFSTPSLLYRRWVSVRPIRGHLSDYILLLGLSILIEFELSGSSTTVHRASCKLQVNS